MRVYSSTATTSTKSALLIMPKYYGYEDKIAEKLNEHYAKVYLVFENLEELSIFNRYAHSNNEILWRKIAWKYYSKVIASIKNEIGCVLIIRGSSIDERIMNALRAAFPVAKFTIYQWDSVKNVASAPMLAKCCDRAITFDEFDAETWGWHYRPLFYADNAVDDKSYDIAFIGTLHTKRTEILNLIKKQSAESGWSLFDYLVIKRPLYIKNRYLTPRSEYTSLRGADAVKFTPLDLASTQAAYAKAKLVVDYTHPNQTGLTMRTIECLGHNCKLLTNNKAVMNADFYDERNIQIYEDDFTGIDETFMDAPYVECPRTIKEAYSLDSWLKELLFDDDFDSTADKRCTDEGITS